MHKNSWKFITQIRKFRCRLMLFCEGLRKTFFVYLLKIQPGGMSIRVFFLNLSFHWFFSQTDYTFNFFLRIWRFESHWRDFSWVQKSGQSDGSSCLHFFANQISSLLSFVPPEVIILTLIQFLPNCWSSDCFDWGFIFL